MLFFKMYIPLHPPQSDGELFHVKASMTSIFYIFGHLIKELALYIDSLIFLEVEEKLRRRANQETWEQYCYHLQHWTK